MSGHKHAALMAEYAKDAMETDRPWERWEVDMGCGWEPMKPRTHHFATLYAYRRKPRTININGHEVPEPVREPLVDGSSYWIPSTEPISCTAFQRWSNDEYDQKWLKRGLIHITREAAALHARALLSFTEAPNDH